MTSNHQTIIALLAAAAKNSDAVSTQGSSYLGSPRSCYQLKNPAKRQVAKTFVQSNPSLSYADCMQLLTDLNHGVSYEEKTIGPIILSLYPTYRAKLAPQHLSLWLEQLAGWGEVDSLCQSLLSAEELLAQWPLWRAQLENFSSSQVISKRRASLVLLVRPAREVRSEKLGKFALRLIGQLQPERDILITKAVSWLLREMIAQYRTEVTTFLAENQTTLPKIAVRETTRKLTTGRK